MWYLLIIIGFALIAIDIMLHGGHAGFFLIFPFFYGRGGILSIIGIILILIGFFLAPFWFIRRATREYSYPPEEAYGYQEERPEERAPPPEYYYSPPPELSEEDLLKEQKPKKKTSFGGVVFIGPFPIVFGGGENKEAVIKWTVIGAIIIGILMIVLVTLYAIFGRTRCGIPLLP